MPQIRIQRSTKMTNATKRVASFGSEKRAKQSKSLEKQVLEPSYS